MLRHVASPPRAPPPSIDFRWSRFTPAQRCPTTMCRYGFSLHGTCHHLVAGAVVEYCEKAVAPATAFSGGLRKCFASFHSSSFSLSPDAAHAAILSEVAFHLHFTREIIIVAELPRRRDASIASVPFWRLPPMDVRTQHAGECNLTLTPAASVGRPD